MKIKVFTLLEVSSLAHEALDNAMERAAGESQRRVGAPLLAGAECPEVLNRARDLIVHATLHIYDALYRYKLH